MVRTRLALVVLVLLPLVAAGQPPSLEGILPAPLLQQGPGGLRWWQWIALPALVVLSVAAGTILGWAARKTLGRISARTSYTWDDALLARVKSPIAALLALAVFAFTSSTLSLPEGAGATLDRALRGATWFVAFWGGFRSVKVFFAAAAESPWAKASPTLAGLLPLGRKFSKVALVVVGAIAVADELGFQVATLLAGLGIGGIALALAAQKSFENFFGSLAIGVDQPFRVGDFVRIEDFTGTVETVGLRSTRVRTLDRTLVTIPNGKLADLRTERFSARDRIRLHANLGLLYGTTAAQMRAVLAGVEEVLRAHEKIWPETVVVRFNAFQDSSLNVEVMAWFLTTDWNEFTAIRQEVFLRFMEVVEKAGTSFAFPTRTVHLVREPAP